MQVFIRSLTIPVGQTVGQTDRQHSAVAVSLQRLGSPTVSLQLCTEPRPIALSETNQKNCSWKSVYEA